MAQRRELINLFIENASNTPITLPIFKKGVPSVNATRKWSWNTSSGSFSCGQISIVINNQLYQLVYDGTLGLQGAIAALTQLGFGFFSYEVILGVTYIYTFDNTNTYGIINFCNPITTTTTTTTTTLPAGTFDLDPNYGLNITNVTGTGSGLPIFTYPVLSGNPQSLPHGVVTAQTFTVSISGTRTLPVTCNVALIVNAIIVDCQDITVDGVQTKNLVLPFGTVSTDNIRIVIGTGACAPLVTTTTTTTTSSTTTTTTLAPYSLGYNASNCTSACTAAQNNYYSPTSPQLGATLYQDGGYTTPAVNGKYSDGVNCYTVSGGSGLITAVSACVITYNISIDSSVDACSALGSYSTNTITFTGGSLTFCNSTGLTILTDKPTFDTYVGNNGFFWLSDGTNYRYYQRTGITYNCVAQDLGCTLC